LKDPHSGGELKYIYPSWTLLQCTLLNTSFPDFNSTSDIELIHNIRPDEKYHAMTPKTAVLITGANRGRSCCSLPTPQRWFAE
jgi:hypothetical protein